MSLRLAFMGTPEFAVPLLAELLAQGHDIAAVYTQPPRPKGRGLAEEPSPVARLAAAHRLQLRTPPTLKTEEAQKEFAALRLDFLWPDRFQKEHRGVVLRRHAAAAYLVQRGDVVGIAVGPQRLGNESRFARNGYPRAVFRRPARFRLVGE